MRFVVQIQSDGTARTHAEMLSGWGGSTDIQNHALHLAAAAVDSGFGRQALSSVALVERATYIILVLMSPRLLYGDIPCAGFAHWSWLSLCLRRCRWRRSKPTSSSPRSTSFSRKAKASGTRRPSRWARNPKGNSVARWP